MITTKATAPALEVQKTKDYSIFKQLEGNRCINQLHLNRLKKSMKEKYLVCPIIVNKHNEIIDGQHRYEAVKELKLPLFYIVVPNYGLEEVQRFNSNQKNFSFEDFLQGYCDLNNEDYIITREFKDRYKLNWDVTLTLLRGNYGGDVAADFRNGEFKVRDLKKADAIAQKLEDYSQFYQGYKRRSFGLAFIKISQSPDYNHKQMMDKLRYLSTRLVDCVNVNDYITLLEGIYNYKSRATAARFQ